MNAIVKTPGIRAAIAAGIHLRHKDAGDPVDLILKKFGDHTDETLKQLKDTRDELEQLGNQVIDLGRAVNGRGANGEKSWGEQVIEMKGLGDLKAERKSMSLTIKTVTTAPTSGGALGRPYLDPNIVAMPRQKLVVRDLLNVINISEGSVDVVRQTQRATNANTVAEGAEKPESNLAWVLDNVPAQVIAHWVRASRQALEDLPQLKGLIDGELLFGLREKEDQQLLNGDGTAPNLDGIIPQATAFAPETGVVVGTPNMIDTLGLAILQNALAEFPADGIVIHPADWMHMRLLKDADGKYILGDPGSNPLPILFGLPVVETKGVTRGNFLVGNFFTGATLYDRWAPRIEVSSEDRDNFIKNMITVLAEERIALAVRQPKAFTYGAYEAGA